MTRCSRPSLREPGAIWRWVVAALLIALASFPSLVHGDPALERDAGRGSRPQSTPGFFTRVSADIIAVRGSSAAWGDYDSDGDLDLAIMGYSDDLTRYAARVYRNDGGKFTDSGFAFEPRTRGALEWGDFDRDGDLDLLVSGQAESGGSQPPQVYRNTGSGLELAATAGPYDSSRFATWGDYDADGRLDFVTVNQSTMHLYRGVADSFVEVDVGLADGGGTVATWLDFDGDDDLDLAVAGAYGPDKFDIYENAFGRFVRLDTPAMGADQTIDAGDYDGDGDLDFLLSGYGATSPGSISVRQLVRLLRRDDDDYVELETPFRVAREGTAKWADYDNDGDLDALIMGAWVELFENRGGDWVLVPHDFGGGSSGTAEWGDFDGDGDLDLLVTGNPGGNLSSSTLWRNDCPRPNAPPIAPGGLHEEVAGLNVRFGWQAAADFETGSAGLSYDLRVGTAPGLGDVVAGTLGAPGRQGAGLGNAGPGSRWICRVPEPGTYYWTVRAIDSGRAAGKPAPERSFEVLETSELVQTGTVGPDLAPFGPQVAAVADVDTDGALDLLISGFDVGGGLSTGLYSREGEAWVEVPAPFPPDFLISRVVWGDFDADGDPDLAARGPLALRVYRNDQGSLVDLGIDLGGAVDGSLVWGDADGDLDLDLLVTGARETPTSRIFENQGETFYPRYFQFPDLQGGVARWGDFDGDGDQDVLFVGTTGSGRTVQVFRNDGGWFDLQFETAEVPQDPTGDWGDLDGDGDLDLALVGQNTCCGYVWVWRNDGGSFTRVDTGIEGAGARKLALFDFDGNGTLEILVADDSRTKVIYDHDGVFIESEVAAPAPNGPDIPFGDLDGDGDLDLIASVAGSSSGTRFAILRHDRFDPDTAPPAPVALRAEVIGRDVELFWSPSPDAPLSVGGPSYALRIGTTPGGGEIVHPVADLVTGRRYVVGWGNAGPANSRSLRQLAPGTYYWSVQSVDTEFRGGAFAAEGSFDVDQLVAAPDASPAPRQTCMGTPAPNPFNARTTLDYSLSRGGHVRIHVVDLAGRAVRTLVDGVQTAGEHRAVWDGCDARGSVVASGVYLVRLEAADAVEVVRAVLVK